MNAYATHVCMVPVEVGRGGSDPLELELQVFEAPCECWDLNPGPPRRQAVLNAKGALQLPLLVLKVHRYVPCVS